MHRRGVEKAHAIATLCGQVNALRERIDRDELVRALREEAESVESRAYVKDSLRFPGVSEGDHGLVVSTGAGMLRAIADAIEAGTFPPKHIEGVDRSPKHIDETPDS